MVHLPVVGGHVDGFGKTGRSDSWWVGPALTFFVFSSFVIYTTWALLQAEHYYAAPYLSPYYSPVLFTDVTAAGSAPLDHAWFGAWPAWWPDGLWFLPASPAILILVFPLSFRMTCYYYRKAYYRAFGIAAGLRGRAARAGQAQVSRRDRAAADPEHPPLRAVLRARVHRPARHRTRSSRSSATASSASVSAASSSR